MQGTHRFVVTVGCCDRDVNVALGRAAGPVQFVSGFVGEVLDPEPDGSSVAFAGRVRVQHGGPVVRGAVGPLARVGAGGEVVLEAQLLGDGRGVGLDPAVVQERLAALAGFGGVDVPQRAGEWVHVGEQSLVDVVEVGQVERLGPSGVLP